MIKKSNIFAFELSGEHSTIPISEVFACLCIENINFKEVKSFDQCLIVEIESDANINKKLNLISKRLSMTHKIIKVIGICKNNLDCIFDLINHSNLDSYISSNESFAVRVKQIKDKSGIHGANLERDSGAIIYKKYNCSVNLKNPNKEFRFILTDNCVFGILVASINRSAYMARAPHKKKFFYPGVLMPTLARALVNISKIKPGEKIFDPFCGTASILIEAGLCGANVIGLDIQSKIIKGAKMNFDECNLDFSLFVGDACFFPLKTNSIDGIVTDPPYGRSALIKAKSLNQLYIKSFEEMKRVLKPGKLLIIVSDRNIIEFAKATGFKVLEKHHQRVHKSLTRIILVLQNS